MWVTGAFATPCVRWHKSWQGSHMIDVPPAGGFREWGVGVGGDCAANKSGYTMTRGWTEAPCLQHPSDPSALQLYSAPMIMGPSASPTHTVAGLDDPTATVPKERMEGLGQGLHTPRRSRLHGGAPHNRVTESKIRYLVLTFGVSRMTWCAWELYRR
jgi:hypothetical protein